MHDSTAPLDENDNENGHWRNWATYGVTQQPHQQIQDMRFPANGSHDGYGLEICFDSALDFKRLRQPHINMRILFVQTQRIVFCNTSHITWLSKNHHHISQSRHDSSILRISTFASSHVSLFFFAHSICDLAYAS